MKSKKNLNLPATTKKYWGGFRPHPFLNSINPMLLDRGFLPSENVGDGQIVSWVRDFFPGYFVSLSFWPKNTEKSNPEAFGFASFICIESARQAEVDRGIGAWECYKLRPGNAVELPAQSEIVFRAYLDWLAERWGGGEYRLGRWNHVRSSFHQEIASDVIKVFDNQGEDFLKYISTPEKLASALLDPYGFPGRREGEFLDISPTGVDPEETAAVLLQDEGNSHAALAALDASVARVERDIARGRADQTTLKIQACKVERYRRWIETGILPNHSASIQA